METVEFYAALTQFGASGLIGAMWLVERRWSASRERQLDEVHERLMREREYLNAVLGALRENTRAMAGVEAGQHRLADVIERLGEDGALGPHGDGPGNRHGQGHSQGRGHGLSEFGG